MSKGVEYIVKSIIAEQFAYPEDDLTLATHLHEEIGVDSMAYIEMLMRLEDRFLIKLDIHKKFQTIEDIVNFISLKVKEAQ